MTEHKKVMKFLKRFKKNWINQEIPDFMIGDNIIIDRDYNSAINLLKFGEFVVYNKSYQTLGKELSEYKAFKCLDFQDQKYLNYN